MKPKRYAIVGAGGRAVMFVYGVVDRFRGAARLVGFCDVSQTRTDWHNGRIAQQYGTAPVP